MTPRYREGEYDRRAIREPNSTMQVTITEYSDRPERIELSGLSLQPVPLKLARRFMNNHHYSGGLGNAAMSWGAYHSSGILLGVAAFQTPISENVRDSIFGKAACGCQLVEPKECNRDDCRIWGHHHHLGEHVTELHRMAVVDDAPKNTGSWLISKALTALKQYKPKYWAVISMADSTEGHVGVQYQGANADYYGTTGSRVEYIDQDGRLRSPRQCGVNITVEEARARGWEINHREQKHRYVFWLPYRSGRSIEGLREFSKIQIQEYPEVTN